jgi:hypothetical protein
MNIKPTLVITITLLIVCINVICLSQTQHDWLIKNKIPIADQLAFSTVQIIADSAHVRKTGTGFFFSFNTKKGVVHAIVTNKHVIKGGENGSFIFTSFNSDGSPNLTNHIPAYISHFEKEWILHPSSNVDLAILPIANLLDDATSKNLKPFYIPLDKDLIPNDAQLKEFTAVEDILMVGYPEGIYDKKNNYPVFRMGTTATHLANKYEGHDEFMIDIASFHGSSGSPVFLLNRGTYKLKSGELISGDRCLLLGILYAGFEYSAKGEIKIVMEPQRLDTLAYTKIPINLGMVIRSSRLLDFVPILNKLMGN